MIYFIGNDSLFECCEASTIENVVEYCKACNILAVDTETAGMDFTCKPIVMFQIGDEENQFIIDTRSVDISPLKEVLEDKSIIKIFHNVKFDYKFIKKWYDITCEGVYDTMLAEQVLNCGIKNVKYGLKDLVKRYTNEEINKEVRNQFINLDGKPYDQSQIVYGAKDVEYLTLIREAQMRDTNYKVLETVVNLENSAALALADIEYNGLKINKSKWKALEKSNKEKALKLEHELDRLVLDTPALNFLIAIYIQGDLFKSKDEIRDINIKWSSPLQVLNAFNKLIPELENVNSKELYKYRRSHKIIDKYIEYKETTKLCSSYGNKFLSHVKADGKIHTNFYQILETGRISSNSPNMQQIPANNEYRNCFTSPSGWSFVSSDYSSQELNVIAYGSQDYVWLDALKKGEDLHSTCAELVYGDEWKNAAQDDCLFEKSRQKCECPKHKKLRTNVKTVNFGLAYGMGPNKLSDTLNISIEDAKALIYKYFKSFPKIKGFLDILGEYGKTNGYIKTFAPYRRVRWFDNWAKEYTNYKDMSIIERASKNTPIQGASADMTKQALVFIREYLRDNNCPVKLVMTVHDQIDTICKDTYLETWKTQLKELMEKAADIIVVNQLLKADVTVSDCWEK